MNPLTNRYPSQTKPRVTAEFQHARFCHWTVRVYTTEIEQDWTNRSYDAYAIGGGLSPQFDTPDELEHWLEWHDA